MSISLNDANIPWSRIPAIFLSISLVAVGIISFGYSFYILGDDIFGILSEHELKFIGMILFVVGWIGLGWIFLPSWLKKRRIRKRFNALPCEEKFLVWRHLQSDEKSNEINSSNKPHYKKLVEKTFGIIRHYETYESYHKQKFNFNDDVWKYLSQMARESMEQFQPSEQEEKKLSQKFSIIIASF